MKFIRTSTLLLFIACITAACSNDDKSDVEMTNGVASPLLVMLSWLKTTQRESPFMC